MATYKNNSKYSTGQQFVPIGGDTQTSYSYYSGNRRPYAGDQPNQAGPGPWWEQLRGPSQMFYEHPDRAGWTGNQQKEWGARNWLATQGQQLYGDPTSQTFYEQMTSSIPLEKEGDRPAFKDVRDAMHDAMMDRTKNLGTLYATGQYFGNPNDLAEAQKAFRGASMDTANFFGNRQYKNIGYDSAEMDPWRADPEVIARKMAVYGRPFEEMLNTQQQKAMGAFSRTGNLGAMANNVQNLQNDYSRNLSDLWERAYFGERDREMKALGMERAYGTLQDQLVDRAMLQRLASVGGIVDMESANRAASLQALGLDVSGGGGPGWYDYAISGIDTAGKIADLFT